MAKRRQNHGIGDSLPEVLTTFGLLIHFLCMGQDQTFFMPTMINAIILPIPFILVSLLLIPPSK